MNSRSHTLRAVALAWIACLFFFAAGHSFVPILGIEGDEALFANALYPPRAELYSIDVGPARIPVMLMSYLGALKTWIYWAIFSVFAPGLRSLREPMVIAGAASLWLFFLLLRRIAGNRAAVIGCGLLAVDSAYLLTTVYDWGPVALQHLLTIGGVLLLIRFYQTKSSVSLAGGSFLLGLVMWDKALAIWMLSGLGIAGILIFPRQIWLVTTKKRVAISALFFILGALPLLIFNIDNHWVTFRGNFQSDPSALGAKARFLMVTAAGSGLLGWLNYEDWQTDSPHQPVGSLQRASARISEFAGRPRHHFLLYAFGLALLIAPLAGWPTLRIVLFSLIALAVAWFQMAINTNTGGSVHHTVLLWPLPHLIVGVAFAGASRRLGRAGLPVVAVLLVVLVVPGVLVLNEHYNIIVRNGGAQAWTDAILNLSDYMKNVPAKNVFCMDWGISDPLRMLNRGRLPISFATEPVFKPQLTEEDRAALREIISGPQNIFIAHTKEYEVFPGNNEKLVQFAAAAGWRTETLRIVLDNFGRPVYDVYKFVKVTSP